MTIPRIRRVVLVSAVLCVLGMPGCTRRSGPLYETPRAESYVDTPGAPTARPGKHSTTTGRHGTAGEVGGGIDAQSGMDPAGDLDERQENEAGAP